MYKLLFTFLLALPLYLTASVNSLLFNATSINNDASSEPDTALEINEGIGIPAWGLSLPPYTGFYSVSFHIPHDYVDITDAALVIVHFATQQEGEIDSGNVDVELDTNFVAIGNVIDSTFATQTTTVSVTSATDANTFNHYAAAFTLDTGIAAGDFAFLNITRNGSADTYSHNIFLTSIEFRYSTGL